MACLMPNLFQFVNFSILYSAILNQSEERTNERARFSFFGADRVETGTEFYFNMAAEKASFYSFAIYT